MSSNQTHHRTFWCHECDMSVHLLSPSAATVDPPPLCPHCHYQNLELMDDPTPTPPTSTSTTDINTSFLDSPSFRQFFLPFFGDFSPSDDDDSDFDSFFDSILPTIKISASFFDADDPESELLCAVCKEQFVVDVEAKLLPCNHLFHPECILPWLNLNHNSCPLCRFQLPSASKLDVSTSESSSQYSFSQLRESRSSIDCNGGLEVGFTHQDDLDCGFPDVGVLSSFLPSHF